MARLDGKVALVTGARRGLGRAAALAFAGAGADVIGLGPHDMPDTRADVEGKGQRFAWLEQDLCDASADALDTAASRAWEAFGRIDILANNAGIIRRAPLFEYSEQDWDDVISVNLKSLFFLTKSVAKRMAAAGIKGRIINTASLLSFQGGVTVPSYAASKHGVAGLTKALANELAPMGITVNAIAPGYMETDNTAALRANETRNRQILERIPAGHWGQADALASTYLYFADPTSGYVTGTVQPVDGGWLAR